MYAINLEQYLETLDSLPIEMKKKFFQMRDLDKKVVDNLRNVDELSENYLSNVAALSSFDKTEQLKNINKRFKKCKEISDSKIQLAIQTYEMVDKYIRRLDAELAKFEAKLQHKAAIIMANSNTFNNSNISGQSTLSNERFAKNTIKNGANTTVKRKLFETSLKRKYKGKALYNDKNKKGTLKDRLHIKKLSHNTFDDDDEIPRIVSKGNKYKKAIIDASKMTQKGVGDGSSSNSLAPVPGLLNLSSTSEEGISNTTALDGAGVVFPFSHPAQILDMPVDPNEPTYCICHQVSYGEMIGCDNPDCLVEWFHFGCVGLTHKPKGKWFCPSCSDDKHGAPVNNTKHRKK